MKLLYLKGCLYWVISILSISPPFMENAFSNSHSSKIIRFEAELPGISDNQNIIFYDATLTLSPSYVNQILQAKKSLTQSGPLNFMMPPIIDPAGPFCENESSVILTANPPGGTWSGTGILNATTGEFDPATAGPGTHIITYTHPTDGSETIDIIVNPAPVIVNISGDGLNCNGDADGNTIVEASGGTPFPGVNAYIYDWDWDQTPENDVYPCTPSGCTGDEQNLSGLTAGIYYVTVTDMNGCTTTGMAEVTEPINSMEASAPDVMLDCYGDVGDIDLTVTNGFPPVVFDWDYDGTGDNDDPEDPMDLPAGTYNVTVTDIVGCTTVATVNITEPDELIVNATVDDVDCFGGNSGEIDLDVSGGTPAYTFDWDYDGTGDNDDPEDPTGLSAGTHNVTVTDANGCTATASVDVMEPLEPVEASATGTDLSCFGQDDGEIDLTPSGGTGNYDFDWDNDGTGDNDDPEDLTGLGPGTYSVTVYDANGCTATASVTLMEPPELTGTFDTTICAGGTIIVNGTTYDESNSSGTEVFTASNGCDSTVTVNVSFDPPFMGEETYTGCEGDGYSVTVGGTVYNESNSSGTETISTADGCDSIVTINLTFLPPVTGEENYTGCEDDGYEVIVNGTTYNEANPSGTETFTGSNGCDSVVTVNLVFHPDTYFELTNQGCQGDNYSVTINGTTYDENNPSGMETITNASGCDSIITINLFFGEPTTSEESYTGCEGDGYSVVVNGTVYNESNPSGVEVMTNADGCDSTITINLTFNAVTTGTETYSGCEGDGYEVIVNGTTYNEANPTGSEILTNAAGCDSIVTISLEFQPPQTGEETYSGCEGDGYEVVVNGTTYNEANPSGTEMLTSVNGCDSIVTINLVFNPHTMFDLTYSGCVGDGYSVLVNGTLYHEGNPIGTETINNAAGCDSVINILLTYNDTSMFTLTYSGCEGDGYTVSVNGTVYNEQNPSGTEVLTNAAGCDSTVIIDLEFAPPTTADIIYNGCQGDGYSIIVNGTVYDESNPDGTETFQNAMGCDSIVTIDLNFEEEINILLDPELCQGGFIEVGGTIYDENNPTGVESFVAEGGCDSIITIDLSFAPILEGFESHEGCEGDGYSVVVNGQIYDELNPDGIEVFTTPEGCDTMVTIDLNFSPALTGTLDTLICSGGFLEIGGEIFDENNPTGEVTLVSQGGCDSIVTVILGFLPIPEGWELYQGCIGDNYSVVVNGQIYDELNPDGMEQFTTSEGCDTIVHIDLEFHGPTEGTVTYEGCSGDGYTIEVNGTAYDESNPNGIEVLEGANQFGCDSSVTVDLIFYDTINVYINTQACEGQGYEIIVNGTAYNESNPEGTEYMETPAGCDSVVHIDLQFTSIIIDTLDPALCMDDSVIVGGTVYDFDNPTGEESFVSQQGCDSIVVINLSFIPDTEEEILYTGCQGDGYGILVNGTAYNENNPAGTEVLTNAAGCDSTIHIELTFLPNTSESISYTGCQGDGYEIVVNGIVYSESNPNGIDTLTAANGCDSVVTVNLVFEDCCAPVEHEFTKSICEGNTFQFGGELLDQTGTYYDTIPDAVGMGCDSIYILQLSVDAVVLEQMQEDICAGESFMFGGVELSETGVYADTFPGGAVHGCDSIVQLDLTVHDLPEANAGDDQLITCAMTSVTLNANIQGGDVLWTGPGITDANDTLQTPVVNKPGLYILTVTSQAGCSATDAVVVNADNDIPIADAGSDGVLDCMQDNYQLQGNVTGSNLAIQWSGPGINTGNASSLNPVVSMAGVYVLTATDTVSQCASAPDTAIVTDLSGDVEAIIQSSGEITCTDPEVILDASQSTSGQHIVHHWEDEAGVIIGMEAVVEVTQGGTYHFFVEDTLGHCADMASIVVEQSDDFPGVDAGPPKQLDCNNTTATLVGQSQGSSDNIAYSWTGPQGGILSDPEMLEITVGVPGWYVITAINTISGCQSKDSTQVSDMMQLPIAEAGDNQQIHCNQTSIELSGNQSSTGPDIVYIWNGPSVQNDTSFVLEVDEEGWYNLIVLNVASGCMSEDSVFIEAVDYPTDADVVVEDVGCIGSTSGMIMVTSVDGGEAPYEYSLGGIIFQSDPVFTELAPGDYTVIVSDMNNCEWSTDITIEDGIDVDIEIGPNIELEFGDTIQLNSILNISMDMVDSIVWAPAHLLSCTHCPNPILTGIESATIIATVYTRGGCEDTDIISLRVKQSTEAYVPNIFSPNGDGINDLVTVFSEPIVTEIEVFEIFDRWGEIVFHKENFAPNIPELGWDGQLGTHKLDPAVFVYKARLKLIDGSTKLLSGDITLVR